MTQLADERSERGRRHPDDGPRVTLDSLDKGSTFGIQCKGTGDFQGLPGRYVVINFRIGDITAEMNRGVRYFSHSRAERAPGVVDDPQA